MYLGRVCWVGSKVITRIISLRSSLLGDIALSNSGSRVNTWDRDLDASTDVPPLNHARIAYVVVKKVALGRCLC